MINKSSKFKVTHQAQRHSRSLFCFVCTGRTSVDTDTIIKNNDHL